MKNLNRGWLAAIALTAVSTMNAQAVIQLALNGDFETGTTTDWLYFPSPSSTFSVVSPGASGTFAGEVTNNTLASAALIKQNLVGVGLLTTGQSVTISFDVKESSAAGGVLFAELFSFNAGGGLNSSQILGGSPLFGSSVFTPRSFTTNLAGDPSGGITLQLTVSTGAAPGSFATGVFDNVSITTIPEPSSVGLAGLGALALLRRRRTSN